LAKQRMRIREHPSNFIPRDLSPTQIYRLAKTIDGYPGEGTFSLAVLRAISHFARYIRQPFYEPLSSYDELLEVTQMKWRLREANVPLQYHYSLEIAVQLFESVYDAPHGAIQMPQDSEREQGEHALSEFLGWDDNGERLYFANTWGEEWGDNGRGSISRAYIDRYMTDAWVSRVACVGPTRFTWERIATADTNEAFGKAWLIPNPARVTRFRHRGFGHCLLHYETISVHTRRYVSVIEIQNGNGLRIAWAFLFHTREADGRPTSILKEFYVWPDFRRRGYGSILEEVAVDVATQLRSAALQCYFHHIDAWPDNRAIGETFAARKGYVTIIGDYRFPRLYVVVEKYLQGSRGEH